jgi:hypothetical protein
MRFLRFWWNFIVGDDWRVAAGIAVALAATYLLTYADVNAWWLLPPAVAIVLYASLWRATNAGRPKLVRVAEAGESEATPWIALASVRLLIAAAFLVALALALAASKLA